MKSKSINRNLILYGIKTGMSLLFPLITFPYVSRILSPTGIGMANYSNSIVTYFILFAGLGVSAYAIREGAPIREDKAKFSILANELLSLNLLTTFAAYILLFLMLLCVPQFQAYQLAIAIYSITILFKTIGVEWIFNIYEDYTYITIRSIVFQFISLILMLLFVKQQSDVYIYILILVFSNVGSSILNYIYARRYWKFKFTFNKKCFKRFIPIVVIFSTTLATTIYSNSDVTMLGWMLGDKEVGIYTVATKFYNILKSMINSIVVVFSTRMMYLIVNDRKSYNKLFQYAFDIIMFLVIPIAFGCVFFGKDIITIIAGAEYLEAELAMGIITFSLIFSCLGNLLSTGALLAIKKEKLMFLATGLGAVINIFLNIFFITYCRSAGAAIATLLTEVIICIILYISFAKNVRVSLKFAHTGKCFIVSLLFGVIKWLFSLFETNSVMISVLAIIICIIVYFGILFLLKDSLVINLYNSILQKIYQRMRKNKEL